MSIYTRRGDDGTTSLADGSRASKASPRIEAGGALDEAMCVVGLARVVTSDTYLEELLGFIQHRLLNCAGLVAVAGGAAREQSLDIAAEDVAALEAAIDRLEARAGKMTNFVLPGGCEAAARLHVARSVIRRAERRLVELAESEPLSPRVLEFVNRTSDVLFAAARWANALAGWPDEAWDPSRPAPDA